MNKILAFRMEDRSTFAKNLIHYRNQRGFPQEYLAEDRDLGIKPSQLSRSINKLLRTKQLEKERLTHQVH